jgi:glycosyltransferase involved in cell wall biosynthesis
MQGEISCNRLVLIHFGNHNAGPKILAQVALSLDENKYLAGVIHSSNVNFTSLVSGKLINTKKMSTYLSKFGYLISLLTLPFKSIIILFYIKKLKSKQVMFIMPHLWDFYLIPFLSVIGRLKIIYWVHDAKPHPGDSQIISRINQVVAIKSSSLLVSLSHFVTNSLKQKTGKKIVNIVHPIESELPLFTRAIKDKTAPKLIFFGRLIRYKGLERLQEAWKIFQEQNNGASLIIAGAGDNEYVLKIFKNSTNVKLILKYLDGEEIKDLLHHCDILVLPYDEASQSGVLVQGIENEIMYVATPAGGMSEQNRILGGGIIAKDMTSGAFVDALNQACMSDKVAVKSDASIHNWVDEINYLVEEIKNFFKDKK